MKDINLTEDEMRIVWATLNEIARKPETEQIQMLGSIGSAAMREVCWKLDKHFRPQDYEE